MAAFYQRFLRSGIDLAPLGAARREDNSPYFCTPKGASIFGWAGVDGIHFCFVRSWGEMVFAVSPMNGWGEYVHPVARDFADFLRLLLACGDTAALEQGWQWDEARFNAFLSGNPPTPAQRAVLARIAERFPLTPMENPWRYLRELQEHFDYSKIKYTEDLTDPDMNPAAPREDAPWAVYYDGSFFGHCGTARAGKEVPCGKWFSWAGWKWYIPALYVCSKGLVLDLCRRVDTNEYAAFLKKWGFDPERGEEPQLTDAQREEIERENPLVLDFTASITLNGACIRCEHGSGEGWSPLLPASCRDAEPLMRHYGLDRNASWDFRRMAFPWKTKRAPKLGTLSLTLTADRVRVPAAHFHVKAVGERVTIPHGDTDYLLTVQELNAMSIDTAHLPADRFYPTHCTVLGYTLSPEPPRGLLSIEDCARGDQPLKLTPDEPFAPEAADDACIGIIGGADGSTAVFVSTGQPHAAQHHSACSALRFEAVTPAEIEWRAVFHEVPCAPESFPLL